MMRVRMLEEIKVLDKERATALRMLEELLK
jgi:hypothetical protein